MIKIFFMVIFFIFIASCGGSDDTTNNDGDNGGTPDVDVVYAGNWTTHGNLKWSDKSSSTMIWDNAKAYCTSLGGRLPNITELRTIIINCPGTVTGGVCAVNEPDHLASTDYSDANCYCDGSADSYSALGDDKNTWLWSSSEQRSANADLAWRVRFGNGVVSGYYKDDGYANGRARCVK